MASSPRTLRILVGGIIVSVLVWEHVQATKIGYQVERARADIRRRRSQLTSELVELESRLTPAQLAAAAKGRLGMVPPAPESIRILQTTTEEIPDRSWGLVRGLLGLRKTLFTAS